MPGYQPGEVASARDIADGKWHYLAMVFDGKSLCAAVDGQQVAGQPPSRARARTPTPGR